MIPRYKNKAIDASTYIQKFGTAASDAEAQGQNKLAGEQARKGAVEMQGARQSASTLVTRLGEFKSHMDDVYKGIDQATQDVALVQAKAEVTKYHDTIRNIDASYPDGILTPEQAKEKHLLMQGVSLKLATPFGLIYDKAYNTTIEADYVNSVKLQIGERAHQLAMAAGNDPAVFKEMWREYTITALKSAPSDATKTLTGYDYDAVGLRTYKSMYSENDKAAKKHSTANDKLALKDFQNQHTNSINKGDYVGSTTSRVGFENLKQKQLNNGDISQEQYDHDMRVFSGNAFLSTNRVMFDQAIEEGRGVQAYEAYKASMSNEDLSKYDPKKLKQENDYMIGKLEQEYTKVKDSILTSFKNGVAPSKDEVSRFNSFHSYGTKEDKEDYLMYAKAMNAYNTIKGDTLSEQEKALSGGNEGLGSAAIKSKEAVKKIVENKKKRANEDPITLGEDEGLYEESTLNLKELVNPNSKTIDKELENRVVASVIAGSKYDTSKPKFFKPNEVIQISRVMDSGEISTDQKLVMINKIAQSTKGTDQMKVAFGQLGEKNSVLTSSARLMNEEQHITARHVIDGNTYIKNGYSVGAAEIKKNVYSTLPQNMLMHPQNAKEMTDAVTAVYVDLMVKRGIDPAGLGKGIDVETMTEAKKMVMGAEVKLSNGTTAYAPHGVSVDDFEEWIDDAAGDTGTFSTSPDLFINPAKDMNEDQTRDMISRATPVRVSKYGYQFRVGQSTLMGQDNKPYVLEYKQP